MAVSRKKIPLLMHDTGLDEEGVLVWFTGKVKSAEDVKGGVEAEVEWDGGWENEEAKVTPCMLLAVDACENEYRTENCWRLA